ncbi:MAG: SpaH/EbpB family LPXTG-anchored major pilin [Ruminococcus sp.]|nr:SpaH/EbpB family LPXTG-anchored major pilin [Ruminococcus sp.]
MAKRIVSLVIIAMMLLAMVPFTASAAAQLTLTMPKDNFEYTVYQVATLDTETGAYTLNTTDEDIKTAMNTPNQSGAKFLAALDKASVPGTNPTVVKKGQNFQTGTLGIYYARATAWPNNVQRKSNTVIVPSYDTNSKSWKFISGTNADGGDALTIDLSTNGKATSGDVHVDKGFDNVSDKDPRYKGQGETVKYTLEATVIGSTDQRAKFYQIYDTMSKGLTLNNVNDVKVYYLDASGNAGSEVTADFDVDYNHTDAKLTGEYADGTFITVTANDNTLKNGTAFYAAKKVRVVYTATVNNNAVVGTPGNPNTDGLKYTNAATTNGEEHGPVVRVYTYVARAYKVDASNANSETPLEGAEIGLYTTEDAAKAGNENDAFATAFTGTDGYAKFIKDGDTNEVRLAPATYWVRELKAPDYYNLNTKVYPVVINASTSGNGVAVNNEAITNTKSKLPQTGGAGTMMFTIIGGALILVAGALFVVVMKKKSSK